MARVRESGFESRQHELTAKGNLPPHDGTGDHGGGGRVPVFDSRGRLPRGRLQGGTPYYSDRVGEFTPEWPRVPGAEYSVHQRTSAMVRRFGGPILLGPQSARSTVIRGWEALQGYYEHRTERGGPNRPPSRADIARTTFRTWTWRHPPSKGGAEAKRP